MVTMVEGIEDTAIDIGQLAKIQNRLLRERWNC